MENIKKIHQIVLQPTTFCNINCSYCYLPNRNIKNTISPKVVENLFTYLVDGDYLGKEVEIRWHAGEPLAVNIELYKQCLEVIENIICKKTNIVYSVQTNALPINKNWCDLFKNYNFKVGVSIDGPQHIHDRNRTNRKGIGTFDDVIKKINLLNSFEIPFSVISVLTDYSLDFAAEIYSFFKTLNPTWLGFNAEETEGMNVSKSFAKKGFLLRYKSFMDEIFSLQLNDSLKIREFEEIKNSILLDEKDRDNVMVEPFRIITVDWNGNTSTFSPELISYPEFVYGNILSETMDEILAKESIKKTAFQIKKGVNKCKKECEYFAVCGGGAPSNKFWENKGFNTTSTFYCTTRYKLITDIILANFENN
ncbi:MAG: cyclophane-forming radical SAM/SPASM peptide maturase GrrM/OscB [Bacteroidota bacterium]